MEEIKNEVDPDVVEEIKEELTEDVEEIKEEIEEAVEEIKDELASWSDSYVCDPNEGSMSKAINRSQYLMMSLGTN